MPKGAQDKYPHRLRRVEVVREDNDEVLVFATNALHLSAATIVSGVLGVDAVEAGGPESLAFRNGPTHLAAIFWSTTMTGCKGFCVAAHRRDCRHLSKIFEARPESLHVRMAISHVAWTWRRPFSRVYRLGFKPL